MEKKPYALTLASRTHQTVVLPLTEAEAQRVADVASLFGDVIKHEGQTVYEVKPIQIAPLIEDPDGPINYCGWCYRLGSAMSPKETHPNAA